MRSFDSVAACVFCALDSLWWRFLLKKMSVSRLEFLANFLGGILVGVVFACLVSVDEFVSFRGRSLQSSRHEAEALDGQFHPPPPSPAAADRSAWRDVTSNDSLAQSIQSSSEAKMRRRQRLLCWVLTSPDNIETRAVHVNRTWGRRCDVLLFMTTKGGPRGPSTRGLALPAVELDVPEGHHRLWGKTKAAFRYVYDRHLHDADWFFKADDDTYTIVENLRRLLDDYDPEEALYLGRRLAVPSVDADYMSGGAGYVLSREAVRRLVTTAGLGTSCGGGRGDEHTDDNSSEDVRMGVCMARCNVSFVDTRDSLGRHRFHPLAPWHYLSQRVFPEDYWLARTDYYAGKAGVECCSLYSITFHYIPDYAMYWMDFILYRFKISGSAKVIFDQHLVQTEHQKVQRMKSNVYSQRRS